MSRPDVLKRRALNRATLARQLLLRRSDRTVSETLEHLIGMQAQAPDAPYVGLWSRLQDFRTDDLSRLIAERRAVRVPLFRATVHLVTASDCLAVRPVVQTVLAKSFAGQAFARNLAGLDLAAVLDAATGFLGQRPRTRGELGACLSARWPGYDPASLAQAVAYLLPVVHVPPRGMWGERGPVALTSVESWLGRSLDADPRPDKLILRYLAAFGPATVRDIQRWSGLTRLRELTERLRPQLRIFRNEAGAELFDLPDAPRPDPATPAPPRFLPEYDNLLLSHDDRGRFIRDGRRVPLPPGNGGTMGTLLVNGDFEATWRVTRRKDVATLTVQSFGRLSPSDTQAIAREGARLLAFIAPEATPDIIVSTSPERRSRSRRYDDRSSGHADSTPLLDLCTNCMGGAMVRNLILALAMTATAVPSAAQKGEVVLWKHVQNWSVYVDRTLGDTCFVGIVFDDGTVFRFGFLEPGSETALYVGIGNPKWRSLEGGKDYEIYLQLDNEQPWRSPARATRIDSIPFLLVGTNEAGFVEELMRKHSLRVQYDGQIILNLSLQGSYAALNEMGACESAIAEYRTSGSAAGGDPFRGRRASNKADPFAQ